MNSPALDPEVFTEMRELMDDALIDFVDTYLSNTPLLISEMETALADNDPETIRLSAHQMKGGSGSIGALGLAELAQHIETVSSASSPERLGRLLRDLRNEFDRVQTELRAWM